MNEMLGTITPIVIDTLLSLSHLEILPCALEILSEGIPHAYFCLAAVFPPLIWLV
jgi:hypothetical protein